MWLGITVLYLGPLSFPFQIFLFVPLFYKISLLLPIWRKKMVYNTRFKAKFGSMPINEWACNMSGFDQAMMGLSYCINWSYSLESHVIQVHFAFSHSWFELWLPVLKIRFRMNCYVCSDNCMGQYMGVTIYCLKYFLFFYCLFMA